MATFTIGQQLSRGMWRAIPKRAYSEVVGWGARRKLPGSLQTNLLRRFVDRVGIDMEEAEKPLEEYGSINDLFTRRLKPGARPIDAAADAVVCPADGKMVAAGAISADLRVEVKNIDFGIAELLAGDPRSDRFQGGSFAIIYLSPRDYHRVHTPAAGRVLGFTHVPGQLFPVNEASSRREPRLFASNERLITWLEGEVGLFAVLMVAAIGVGHITLSYDDQVGTHGAGATSGASRKYEDPPILRRGAEIGIFHLGSTAIMLFEKGRVAIPPLDSPAPVRMGARAGRTLASPL